METTIEIIANGDELVLEQTQDLYKWLIAEKLDGVKLEKQQNISNESMGALEIGLLLFIAARPLLVEVVRSINVWIKERKPKATVKITDKETGQHFEINMENVDTIDKTVDKIVSKLR